MKAFVIHGAYGTPQENWLPWLKRKLEKIGYEVSIPQFPTPVGQNLQNWLDVWGQYKDECSEDTIIIGHSIGVAFILNILERLDQPIHAAYFVAGFIRPLHNEEVDNINLSFYEKPFNWETIKKNCKRFICFSSDDDPYVSVEYGEELAKQLGVEMSLVKKAGHFNSKSGYTEFSLLFKSIEQN